jgi:hypothetical protein
MTEKDLDKIVNENPPIMQTWSRLYTLVLCVHLAIVLVFTYLTFHYK